MAPEPSWWSDSYSIGQGSGEQPFACLSDDKVVTIIRDVSNSLEWLTIFDGVDWQIVHEFLIGEGSPGAIYGNTGNAIAVFYAPASNGVFFNGVDVSPMTIALPEGIDSGHIVVTDIAGDEAQGYFAVGYWRTLANPNDEGFVWRSDDLQVWEEVEGVPHLDPTIYLNAYYGVDIDEEGQTYVVGLQYREDFVPGDHTGVILRYDGSSWFEEDIPPFPDADPGQEWWTEFYGVWCVNGYVFVGGGGYPNGWMQPVALQFSPP
jgi:hypothetical protein